MAKGFRLKNKAAWVYFRQFPCAGNEAVLNKKSRPVQGGFFIYFIVFLSLDEELLIGHKSICITNLNHVNSFTQT